MSPAQYRTKLIVARIEAVRTHGITGSDILQDYSQISPVVDEVYLPPFNFPVRNSVGCAVVVTAHASRGGDGVAWYQIPYAPLGRDPEEWVDAARTVQETHGEIFDPRLTDIEEMRVLLRSSGYNAQGWP